MKQHAPVYASAVTGLACLAVVAGSALANEPCRLEAGTTHTVARVLDGETLALDDGRIVRLADVLAPRAFDVAAEQGAWKPEADAAALLDAMALGKTVVLAYGPLRQDRHGRTVAHLYLGERTDGAWLQGRLVEAGGVRAQSFGSGPDCVQTLIEREDTARSIKRGIWSNAAYEPRLGASERLLRPMMGSVQVVVAPVARVISTGRGYRLLLGRGGARELSVLIAPEDRGRLGALGGDATALTGRTLEVRGWITARRDRSGIEIDLAAGGHVRVLGELAAEGSETAPRRRTRRN
jgi:endonuclease YncB( thermonuclease family)